MNYYEDLLEDQYVPLTCIDSRLVGKYEINKLGHIRNTSTGKIRNNIKGVGGNYPRVSLRSSQLYSDGFYYSRGPRKFD